MTALFCIWEKKPFAYPMHHVTSHFPSHQPTSSTQSHSVSTELSNVFNKSLFSCDGHQHLQTKQEIQFTKRTFSICGLLTWYIDILQVNNLMCYMYLLHKPDMRMLRIMSMPFSWFHFIWILKIQGIREHYPSPNALTSCSKFFF